MQTADIIGVIDAENARLQQAKVLLSGMIAKLGPARSAVSVAPAMPKKNHMSAAGRASRVVAQKARWATAQEGCEITV